MSDGITAIIDIGSETTKAGFSDDSDPISVIPTVCSKIFKWPTIDRLLKANDERKYFGEYEGGSVKTTGVSDGSILSSFLNT